MKRSIERDEDSDSGSALMAPLTDLPGIGPAMAQRFAARNLLNIGDLLFLLPVGYFDDREMTDIAELASSSEASEEPPWMGQRIRVRAVVRKVRFRRGRRGHLLEVGLAVDEDAAPVLWCNWFQAFISMKTQFVVGEIVEVKGEVRRYKDRLQISHPEYSTRGSTELVSARYPDIDGVAPRLVAQSCREACRRAAEDVLDPLPIDIAEEFCFPELTRTLRTLHLIDTPDPAEMVALQTGDHIAQRRLAFTELFVLQVVAAQRRAAHRSLAGIACQLTEGALSAAYEPLPFALTDAQQRVVGEILRDMGQDRPMHRLLQGDVGSGKTVVAYLAAFAAMTAGFQVAVMAPTEVLAEQHFAVLRKWCQLHGFHVALLTASTPRPSRESTLALLDGGLIHLVVGTHALLAERVNLPNLALVVVDEQHRFGVMQRLRLREKGGGDTSAAWPHLLVMTATPIPRSLALTVYGDLDLSIIDEHPPGREPAKTHVLWHPTITAGKRAAKFVEQQLEAGQQIFVVCPLVEASEKLEVSDVVTTHERLSRMFKRYQVGLVHGRLSASERNRQIEHFRQSKIQLLVATTVIEVGIDIAGANVMVIEHAERFGLSQLHQLRGRVGRRDQPGRCLLLSGTSKLSLAAKRLRTLEQSTDGFEIAEADLSLRGPGELLGTQQAGIERLRYADLRRHALLLVDAQRSAREVIARDPELLAAENRGLKHAVEVALSIGLQVGHAAG